jgi:hypothetical protein
MASKCNTGQSQSGILNVKYEGEILKETTLVLIESNWIETGNFMNE